MTRRSKEVQMAETLSLHLLNQTGAIFVKKVVTIATSRLILQELESVPAVETLVVLFFQWQTLGQSRFVHF